MTKEQGLQKIKHYCGYQERCHAEVKSKLYSYGLWKKDVESIVSDLIEQNYLNEERFAQMFAGGHFRLKQWGRVKIKHELKQKLVSEHCIKKALKEINEADYRKTIKKLFEKKWNSLKAEKNMFVKKSKATNYLLQKGFESALINEVMSSHK